MINGWFEMRRDGVCSRATIFYLFFLSFLYWIFLEDGMSKYSYCNKKIHLEDFFKVKDVPVLERKVYNFTGEVIQVSDRHSVKMWSCPWCDSILGFSEFYWDRSERVRGFRE